MLFRLAFHQIDFDWEANIEFIPFIDMNDLNVSGQSHI